MKIPGASGVNDRPRPDSPGVARGRAWSFLFLTTLAANLSGQTSFNWAQIRDKFESTNPTLKANQLNIDESRAAEITAYLRPNPDLTLSTDGTQLSRFEGVWRPFAGTQYGPALSYMHEREHKRELRWDPLESTCRHASLSIL